jgi:hypothetical protein
MIEPAVGRLIECFGIRRWSEGPVGVPRREVTDRQPPQAFPGRVEFGEPCPFGVGHTEVGQCTARVRRAVTVDVEICQVATDPENLNHAAVRRSDPLTLCAVVVAGRHGHSHGEAEEVLDVDRQRLAEAHFGGVGGEGLVGTQLYGVGVAAGGRQVRGHGHRAVVAHRVLGCPHVQGVERLGCSVGQDHLGSVCRREEERRLACAVCVGRGIPPGHLHDGGSHDDVGDPGVERDQGDVLHLDIVLPGDTHLTLGGQEIFFFVLDDQFSTAVDDEVVHAVAEGRAGALQYATAQDGGPPRLDGLGCHAGLDGVFTGVQKLSCAGHRGRDGWIHRGGDSCRIGRQAGIDRTTVQGVVHRLHDLVDGDLPVAALVERRAIGQELGAEGNVHAAQDLVDGDFAVETAVARARLRPGRCDGCDLESSCDEKSERSSSIQEESHESLPLPIAGAASGTTACSGQGRLRDVTRRNRRCSKNSGCAGIGGLEGACQTPSGGPKKRGTGT